MWGNSIISAKLLASPKGHYSTKSVAWISTWCFLLPAYWRLHHLTIQKAVTWILEEDLNKVGEDALPGSRMEPVAGCYKSDKNHLVPYEGGALLSCLTTC